MTNWTVLSANKAGLTESRGFLLPAFLLLLNLLPLWA